MRQTAPRPDGKESGEHGIVVWPRRRQPVVDPTRSLRMSREALVARRGTQPRQVYQRQLAAAEARLHVALDNMPGGLVYTDDDLNIALRNERFRETYRATTELLQPGQPQPKLLTFHAGSG